MQLAESIVHLNVVVTAQQLVTPLVVARVKQTVRVDVTMVVAPLAIKDAQTNVGELVLMGVPVLVL